MVLGTLSTVVAAGVVGYTYFAQNKVVTSRSDAKKIQRICVNRGLVVKEGKATRTMQQLTRRDINGGKEYVFRLPLGLSFNDFEKQTNALQDGLNNRRAKDPVTLNDIKAIRRIDDIKKLINRDPVRVNKEVEMSYDGTLRVRVYDQSLPDKFIYSTETLNSCSGWQVPVGLNRSGLIKHDFESVPHMLVAGATGKGKSVYLKNVITTLIANKPDDVEFTLIDLKGGLSFARYAHCRQTACLAKDARESYEVLSSIREQLESRMAFLLANGYEDVSEMGDKKRHFIVIDESAELSSAGESDSELKKIKVACESLISDIARRGRACGFRLIYATQYPTNETLKSQVRQNIGARVCFYLSTAVASRVVLDEDGAEDLPEINGRAIYKKDKCITVQTPFIRNDFIKETINPHIVKEERHAKVTQQNESRGTDTLILEETGLFES